MRGKISTTDAQLAELYLIGCSTQGITGVFAPTFRRISILSLGRALMCLVFMPWIKSYGAWLLHPIYVETCCFVESADFPRHVISQ